MTYTMPDEEFGRAIDEIQKLYPDHVAFKRTIRSMYLEWMAHNFLFRMGIRKDKAADVDLEYPQSWFKRLGYGILGILGKIFIK